MTDNPNKYITDMKELPPESISDVPPVKSTSENIVPKNIKTEAVTERSSAKKNVELENPVTDKIAEKLFDGRQEYDERLEVEEKSRFFTNKDLLLGIINMLCIGVILFLVVKFPGKSEELRNERNQLLLNDSGLNYEFSEINESKKKVDEIAGLFVDDSGVTDFLNEVGLIQASGGLIKKISFGNQKAVEDKTTGLYGVPVIIEFVGDFNNILSDIDKIQQLPFVLRAISVDTIKDDENPDVVNLKYGAFLYVNNNIGQ